MSAETPRTDGLILRYEVEPDGEAWPNLENGIRQLEIELTAAQAEIAALRKDAERLDAIVKYNLRLWKEPYDHGKNWSACKFMAHGEREIFRSDDLRAAVDAAIDASKG